MNDLVYTLRQLCQRNRDSSHATQADRLNTLTLIKRQMRASSLKGKPVEALLALWQSEGLAAGTQKNCMVHIRWWAEKVGNAGIIPADNALLAIPDRQFVTNENRARQLDQSLARVSDAHVRMSLELQAAFGLRREESLKFRPGYADQGDHIVLKASWTKGSRTRTVPITPAQQRAVLDQAHRLPGAGSLIPPRKTYIEQRHTYDGQCQMAGLNKMQGLRHHGPSCTDGRPSRAQPVPVTVGGWIPRISRSIGWCSGNG